MEILKTDFAIYNLDRESYLKMYLNKSSKTIKFSVWSEHPTGTQINLELNRNQARTFLEIMDLYGWGNIYTMLFHWYGNKIKIDNISVAKNQSW